MRGGAPHLLLVVALAAGCAGTTSATPTTSGTGTAASGTTGTTAPPAWSERKVEVDGASIAVRCAGEGRKTVVFIGNLAEDGDTAWRSSTVPDAIARDTRVCVYDRPGLGASTASTKERTVPNQVADLAALVEAKALPTPVVVVGHRYGTFIARQYAHDHVRDIAGVVLVDPPLEMLDPTAPAGLTPGQQAEYATVPGINTDLGAYGAGKLPPPPAPTIVLGPGDLAPLPTPVPPGGPTFPTALAKQPAEAGDVRRGGQQLLARKSPFGSFQAVDGSGSYLQFWQPGTVVDAITTVLQDPRSPR